MKHPLCLSLFVFLTGCAATPADLPTEPSVALERYAGTWYEQARLPNRFQRDCVADVRADYTLQPDGSIKVVNQCRIESGEVKLAEGEGRLSPAQSPRDPAKLEVRFAPEWISALPMVWGDYWIIRLTDDYQYSLVGTPDREYLWVLSRDKSADPADVNELLAHAKALGFPVDEVVRSTQEAPRSSRN